MPKNKTATPQCINCGENHTANYRGCQVYQEILKTKDQNKSLLNRSQNSYNRNDTPNLRLPDLSSSAHFPTICDNDSVKAPPKFRVPFAKAAASTHRDTSSISPESTDNNTDVSLSQSLEQIILDIVKSFIPALRKIINNVISSVLSNGSV